MSDDSQPVFFSARPTREAGRALLHDEHRHVALAAAGLGGDEVQVGVHAVGDEHLGAVEHPVVALTLRRGADARHVGAGARLGDADRRDQLAGDHLAQVLVLLRRAARVVQVRAGHVGVDQHGDDEAGEGRLRQRLGEHQVGQRVGLRAAVRALVHQAEQAGLAHAAQHVARHEALLFPGRAVRLDFLGDELRDLVAQQFVFGVVVDRHVRCQQALSCMGRSADVTSGTRRTSARGSARSATPTSPAPAPAACRPGRSRRRPTAARVA